jgi:malonyl-CoA decarboxylase
MALCRALLSERGEISGARLAGETLAVYHSFDQAGRAAFFDSLAAEFSPHPDQVAAAADAYRAEPSAATLVRLQRVVEPPRQELFRRLNLAPEGTRTLVDMRRHLLQHSGVHPQWLAIESDLMHLLRSWFNRGFLQLRRIDWTTPAIILEKLIEYEAVHQIHGWGDLRRRLEKDRRCYAFFHPALDDDPIIFVEVALTRGMSGKVQPLVDPATPVGDPGTANCAIFYSITNCQDGLRGVPFGDFLIKKVVEDLGQQLPQIKTFATVSPVPGFREWLARNFPAEEKETSLALSAASPASSDGRQKAPEPLQRELTALCSHYLLHAKHGREPLDPVARFHLRNGARLERINWRGDTSASGFERSAGLTVNYLYRLSDLERNHEMYMKEYRVVASLAVESLARGVHPRGRTAVAGPPR